MDQVKQQIAVANAQELLTVRNSSTASSHTFHHLTLNDHFHFYFAENDRKMLQKMRGQAGDRSGLIGTGKCTSSGSAESLI